MKQFSIKHAAFTMVICLLLGANIPFGGFNETAGQSSVSSLLSNGDDVLLKADVSAKGASNNNAGVSTGVSDLYISGHNLQLSNSFNIVYYVKYEVAEGILVFPNSPLDSTYGASTEYMSNGEYSSSNKKGYYNISARDERRGTYDSDNDGRPDYDWFAFDGLAARQMTDYFYAVAYTEDRDKDYGYAYSALDKYSVLTYCNDNKDVDSTYCSGGTTLAKTCQSILTYGAAVQNYFGYTDRLATDTYYSISVDANVGTLKDGFASGLYNDSETVYPVTTDISQTMLMTAWSVGTHEFGTSQVEMRQLIEELTESVVAQGVTLTKITTKEADLGNKNYIQGIVCDMNNNPLCNVDVSITNPDQTTTSCKTDTNGYYYVEVTQLGKYTVSTTNFFYNRSNTINVNKLGAIYSSDFLLSTGSENYYSGNARGFKTAVETFNTSDSSSQIELMTGLELATKTCNGITYGYDDYGIDAPYFNQYDYISDLVIDSHWETETVSGYEYEVLCVSFPYVVTSQSPNTTYSYRYSLVCKDSDWAYVYPSLIKLDGNEVTFGCSTNNGYLNVYFNSPNIGTAKFYYQIANYEEEIDNTQIQKYAASDPSYFEGPCNNESTNLTVKNGLKSSETIATPMNDLGMFLICLHYGILPEAKSVQMPITFSLYLPECVRLYIYSEVSVYNFTAEFNSYTYSGMRFGEAMETGELQKVIEV